MVSATDDCYSVLCAYYKLNKEYIHIYYKTTQCQLCTLARTKNKMKYCSYAAVEPAVESTALRPSAEAGPMASTTSRIRS